jgi:hypothetical protein
MLAFDPVAVVPTTIATAFPVMPWAEDVVMVATFDAHVIPLMDTIVGAVEAAKLPLNEYGTHPETVTVPIASAVVLV